MSEARAAYSDEDLQSAEKGVTTHSPKWRSGLREVIVIIAGVLGALAGQAWWQSHQDNTREQDYVRQLLADTRENEQRLDGAIARDSADQEVLRRVGTAMYAPEPPPSDSVAAWLTNGALGASDFQPLSGTYGALIASGDLHLIRSDSLRTRLVAYSAMLASEGEMLRFFLGQEFSNPGVIARTLPFMSRLLFDSHTAGTDASASGFHFEQLRNNPDFAALLFTLRIANSNRLEHLRRMRGETRRLRTALEAEIPDSPPPREKSQSIRASAP